MILLLMFLGYRTFGWIPSCLGIMLHATQLSHRVEPVGYWCISHSCSRLASIQQQSLPIMGSLRLWSLFSWIISLKRGRIRLVLTYFLLFQIRLLLVFDLHLPRIGFDNALVLMLICSSPHNAYSHCIASPLRAFVFLVLQIIRPLPWRKFIYECPYPAHHPFFSLHKSAPWVWNSVAYPAILVFSSAL